MEYAHMLGGGAPLFDRFAIGETFADPGIPALEPDANGGGVALPVTTDFSNAVGVTLDTATFVTAQQTDGSSAEREIGIIISPDAVFRALMSGGATEGTALTRYPVTTESTTGLVVTTASIANWASPTFDESTVWFDDGANAGQRRRVVSVSGTAATVKVAFDQDTVVGDNVLRAPYWPLGLGDTLQLTTKFFQADVSIAHALPTASPIKTRGLELNGVADSFVLFIFDDHALGQTRS